MTTKKQAREARRARLAAARAAAARQAEPTGARPADPRSPGVSPREKLAAAALALMVGISFVPAYRAGFVWDDTIFADSPVIREASGLKKIWFASSDLEEAHYWPVTYTTFWLEHKLWGFEPLGYHVVNVLLHAVNVLLVWRLLRRFAVAGAWVVAAVFAVHPLRVESVVWVIERKDVLSGLFYLTSFLAYVRFTDRERPVRYLLALGLFAAGLLSKTVVVTLPAALLIWHWWQRGRITRSDLLRTAPFFAVGLTIAAADTAFYRTREVLALDYSFVERILIAGRALWFYAGKLVWPDDLAVIYPLWDIRSDDATGWLYVAGAVAAPAVLWLGRGRWGRGPLACTAFYAATLSPALGLIDYGYMQFALVADRFQYLAGIGLLTLVVAALVRAVRQLPAAGVLAGKILLAAVLASFGTLTWRHAANFQDDLTLFSHVVSLNPEARDAHLNLSEALMKAGRLEEGLKASRTAVEKRPDSPGAHSNLGLALMILERFEEAETAFGRALEIDPRHRNGHQNLGELRKRQGRYDEAVEQHRRALEIDPDWALGWTGVANAHSLAGLHEEAAEAASRSLAIDSQSPNAAVLHHIRAEALRRQQRHEEALALYREALEIDSRLAQASAGMGVALFELERYGEAIDWMERALVLAPELPAASSLHQLTGRALQELGRLDEAAEQFARTLELDPRDTESLDRLAFLRFNAGRYQEAIEHYRALLGVDPADATAHSNLGIALLNLERYEEATRSLERSLELDPEQPVARAALTEARQKSP